MHSKAYDLNDIRLHVYEAGPQDGLPVILLHGFPEAGFAWEQQVIRLAAKGYRVFAPDQRGYNRSSKPRGVAAYSIQFLVGDIIALMDATGCSQAVLVGHDWGGAVAWHLAMQHPDRVSKLIILNMPHPEVMRQTLLHNGKQRKKSSYAAFFQLPWAPEWLARRNNYKWLEQALVKTSRPNTFTQTTIARYKQAWAKPGALTAMINWYRAYSFVQPKNSRPLALPVLIIWGKKDAFLLYQMAVESAAHCTHAQLVTLDDATHWLHHEAPQEVNARILGFLEPTKAVIQP
ncbi:Pimeloyl-ACP methyl ester carboxylesterase [Cnuella takakiae]|uniref:Pimeloyl-ACP methyl ester carboxylesterase n=1 Tax=Cnuella takakiae TaxID=1302690 RepID=A0A1M4ZHP7_9BACT|nr:alpha/beta hydrolase [Cnuella takakiae]OLY94209.1 hypothetical protein BUE76_21710 [Cnuella takakiae]SHF17505.1 Pimeloyl-ACP methyl ester carboxylesterase [Cnuella takakiae]